MSSTAVGKITFEDSRTRHPKYGSFYIAPYQTIKIGRDDDPKKNNVAFDSPDVSRNHMEFYCIVVDEEAQHCPLVFVRDRQSSYGTYVNGQLIGKRPDLSPGWLLQNGDIISITSDLSFQFTQLFEDGPSFTLSAHQQEELAVTLYGP